MSSLCLTVTSASLSIGGCSDPFASCEAHKKCPVGGEGGQGRNDGSEDGYSGGGAGPRSENAAGTSFIGASGGGAHPEPVEEESAGGSGGVPEAATDGGAAPGSEPSVDGVGSLNAPCEQEGAFACAGRAQRFQLVCADGRWQNNGTCGPGENCDTSADNAGLCEPVVAGCVGLNPGDTVCEGSTVLECGVDLVSVIEREVCSEQACADGACSGLCEPGQARCAGNTVEVCSEIGTWEQEPCPAGLPSCVAGQCEPPPSCEDLPNNCGAARNESCCMSLVVPGGTFNRNNDERSPARVSTFRLDKYEVTVGRFRKFLIAWDQGWRPQVGSGRHVHLHEGKGLATTEGGFEEGWTAEVQTHNFTTYTDWSSYIAYNDQGVTWTHAPGNHENRPMNASTGGSYAFCIWDGGFLPTEAEWNYAAAGGSEQRRYPWGNTPPGQNANHAIYGCFFGGEMCDVADVGSAPTGNGRWGHADLAGNFEEILLDAPGDLAVPCIDGVRPGHTEREYVVRGGSYTTEVVAEIGTSYRTSGVGRGVRCARSP